MRLPRTDTWLTALLAGAGTLHLVRPRTAAAMLLAFVPAHLHTIRVDPEERLPLAVATARLPLQVPLVAAALRVARGR